MLAIVAKFQYIKHLFGGVIYKTTASLYDIGNLCLGKKKKSFSNLYDLKEIIYQQNRIDGYNRLDIFVRLLAIENEYGINSYGWDLYRKMQSKRCSDGGLSVEERVKIFKDLIRSWDEKGYDKSSKIRLDVDLMLEDGSHRLALAIYHNIDRINCYVSGYESDIYYGSRWFLDNDFSSAELEQIRNKCDIVLENLKKVEISCILWPPASNYFDEITDLLKSKYEVHDVQDFLYSKETFVRFVRAVYNIDDIAKWKIDKKIEYMNYAAEKKVRFLKIAFSEPRFRYKEATKNTILTQGEALKREIRDSYKGKIEKYFYDIICHTGDNEQQSIYIEKLFYSPISLTHLFPILPGKWMIIKLHTENLPASFPKNFPFSKDIDIICSPDDYNDIVMCVLNYVKCKSEGYYDPIKVISDDSKHCKIRIELCGYLILQFDILAQSSWFSNEFISASLERRIHQDIYYIPLMRDELCYRMCEYLQNPHKEHHLQYMKEHHNDIDEKLMQKAMNLSFTEIKKVLVILSSEYTS